MLRMSAVTSLRPRGAARTMPGEERQGLRLYASVPSLNYLTSPCLLSPLRPPGGGCKGLGEVLRLVYDVSRAKLHDAHGVIRFPVVGDDQFGDPEIAVAAHAPDEELPPCRVVATLALDVASPMEPLTRLWILENRIIGVDR